MKILFLVLFVSVCFVFGSIDEIFKDYLPFTTIDTNSKLHREYINYLEWIVSLDGEGSDANYTLKQINSEHQTLDGVSIAFHEKVEFLYWLELGHEIEDITKIEYYQANYMKVYPVAHRRSMVAEMNLIKYFSKKHSIDGVPELAYLLVHPMREKRKSGDMLIPLKGMATRLAFNIEYHIQSVSKDDLVKAIKTFELGGYQYENKLKILEGTSSFKCDTKCWCNFIKRYHQMGYILNKKIYSNCFEN